MKVYGLGGALGVLFLTVASANAWCMPVHSIPQPNYGPWGLDLSAEDKSIKPGDDFNAYANGTYITNLKIPADQTRYGTFNILEDLSEARVHAILKKEAAKIVDVEPRSPDGKTGAAYKAFMDEARVESLGAKPLDHDLSAVHAVRTRSELAFLMGNAAAGMQASLFSVGIRRMTRIRTAT